LAPRLAPEISLALLMIELVRRRFTVDW
jgi:hypothetical protein